VRWDVGATGASNGQIYAIGGYYNFESPPQLSVNEAYNPGTNLWTEQAPMPTERLNLGVVLARNGQIYAIGGETGLAPYPVFNTVEVYNPTSNTWATAASLPEPRSAFGAAVGQDGTIYIFGGYTTGRVPDNLVYAYNPTTNTWSSRAPMPTARYFDQAVRELNGNILVTGGNSLGANVGKNWLSTVEEYAPTTDTWTTRPSLPVAELSAARAHGSDGRIYIIGGEGSSGTLGTVQIYDPTTQSWSLGPSMLTPREGAAAAVIGSGIYTIGGALSPMGGGSTANEELTITTQCVPTATSTPTFTPTTSATATLPPIIAWTTRTSMPTPEYNAGATTGTTGLIYVLGGEPAGGANQAYDPTHDQWLAKAPMPSGHFEYGVVAAKDGLIYAIGGAYTAEMDIYNPVTDAWSAGPSMPAAQWGFGSALGADGNIYVFAGNQGGQIVNTTLSYSPITGQWTSRSNIPTARQDPQAVAAPNGLIYVIGGYVAGQVVLNTVEAYDPVHDSWSTKASLPVPEMVAASALGSDGRIYITGGYGNTGSCCVTLNAVQIYDPTSNTWTLGPNLPTARQSPSGALGPDGNVYVFGGSVNPQGAATGETDQGSY
jgi:N-acetylneuraminic acid mutarotase